MGNILLGAGIDAEIIKDIPMPIAIYLRYYVARFGGLPGRVNNM
jgi:hypothetical protein